MVKSRRSYCTHIQTRVNYWVTFFTAANEPLDFPVLDAARVSGQKGLMIENAEGCKIDPRIQAIYDEALNAR